MRDAAPGPDCQTQEMTMMPKLRWMLCFAVVAGMASYVTVSSIVAPREPFGDGRWQVESVMVLEEATTTKYKLDAPYRVIRDGGTTFQRDDGPPRTPVIRVDLTVDGEHVVMFTHLRQ
jgi:hypothetical protein